jgi:hypothetical protein
VGYFTDALSNIETGLASIKGKSPQDERNAAYSAAVRSAPPGEVGGNEPPYAVPQGANLAVLSPQEQMQVDFAIAAKKPIPAPILWKLTQRT